VNSYIDRVCTVPTGISSSGALAIGFCVAVTAS